TAAADVRDVADARGAIAQLVMGRYALEADGLAFQDALDVRPALLEELRAEHLAHVDTGGRLRLEATPLAVARIDEAVAQIPIDVGDERGHVVGHQPQAALAFGQRLLGADALGDVEREAAGVDELAV